MWQLIFWVGIGVIVYSYVGYPAALYILSQFKRRRHEPTDLSITPSVCLIISAFNEEAVIREKIENSLALDYPRDRFMIAVASDGSTDRTVAIAREYEDKGVEVFVSDERHGKSAVLNRVVASRSEDVIVFTDANSIFSTNAITALCRNFNDARVGCVVGKLRYVDDTDSNVGRSEGIYWRYEGVISRLESHIASVLVANGSIFAIRRGLYRDVYPEVANDFQVPMDIADAGYGVVYEPEAVAMEHTASYWHEEFGRKVRIILRGLTGFGRLRSRIRGMRLWQFWSHKLARWLIGLMLVSVFAANVALADESLFYTLFLAVQLFGYFAALNGWLRRESGGGGRLSYIAFYFTMVNTAALVALYRYVTGTRLAVWEKAESTRPQNGSPDTNSESDAEPAASAESTKPVELEPAHAKIAKT